MQFENARGIVEKSWVSIDKIVYVRVSWNSDKILKEIDQECLMIEED